jgi:hypothetical protein
VLKIFEKNPEPAYLSILFSKLDNVTVAEFRAMKMRVFDECEYFPKLTKWVQLKNWVLDKRIHRPMSVDFSSCHNCLSTGFIKVLSSGVSTVVKCSCEASNRWQKNIPALEQVDNYKIIPWTNSEFRPNKDCTFDNRVEWFKETINIAEQFWMNSKFYKKPTVAEIKL